jgi:hypothetical protein
MFIDAKVIPPTIKYLVWSINDASPFALLYLLLRNIPSPGSGHVFEPALATGATVWIRRKKLHDLLTFAHKEVGLGKGMPAALFLSIMKFVTVPSQSLTEAAISILSTKR